MTKPDFSDLPGALPELTFDLQKDLESPVSSGIRAYLDHYLLPVAEDTPGVQRALGRVSLVGFDILVHYWRPPEPKGTLIIVHGYFDHSGLYGQVVRFGLAHGLTVLAYDQPGHGLSSGERLAIDDFDRYADVLAALLRRAEPVLSGPRYTLGQSMGGAVLLNHLWRYGSEPTGRIALCAPLVLPRAWGLSKWLHTLLRRWVKCVPRTFSDSSHDPDFNEFLARHDGLQDAHVSVQWVGAMREWDQRFRGLRPREDELLVVQGTGDGTVDWRYNLMQIRRKLPNVKVEMIEGARHQLVNESEPYRARVFAAVERFFFG